jgi:hypothetical protein
MIGRSSILNVGLGEKKMSLTVSEGKGGDFKLAPAGNHLARCYRVIDLGTQKVTWQGVEKASKKVQIVWELHGEDSDGVPLNTDKGFPLSVQRRFTPSLGAKATLRSILVSWRGRPFTPEELEGFALKNILGAWCMLTITHENRNEKTYANVSSVTSVPATIKKMGLPEPVNDLLWFDIDEPDMEVFNSFPDYLKEVIEKSPEWKMRTGDYDNGFSKVEEDQASDDIPF